MVVVPSATLGSFLALMQIVNAWHRNGYWLGDIKPSNFVLGLVTTTDGEGHTTSGSLRVFVIDLEAVVRDFQVGRHSPERWAASIAADWDEVVVVCWR